MPHVGKKMRFIVALTCALPCTVAPLAVPVASAHGASTAPSTAPPLPERGDRSEDVARLQRQLIAAGVRVSGGADGVFGPATANAVASFQQAKGLTPSGAVNAATAVALGLRPPTPVLTIGASGTKVSELQRRLTSVGLRPRGGADGRYGPSTADAVRRFQTSARIDATGAVDPYTAALLAARASGEGVTGSTPAESVELGPGSTGPAVRDLQQRLAAAGTRPRGGVDGVYGPATAASVAVFQRWNGLEPSGRVDRRTAAALVAAAGGTSAPRLAHFPLPRTCMFWDTWGAPRAGGRRHEGTDIFARRGTPILAVADGRITKLRHDVPGSRGGNQFWLTAKDGTKYFYGHLDGFARGMGVGVPVRAGDVLGYAGSTGLTSAVHLHFEVHPGGGGPVNPYPILVRTSGCRGGQ